MNIRIIKKLRFFTILLWLYIPVGVAVVVYLLSYINSEYSESILVWVFRLILPYIILCYLSAYILQKTKCPNCHGYMFRGGNNSLSCKSMTYHQCNQCGYEL